MTKLLPLALVVLAIAACSGGNREPVETRLKSIRTYGWPASVVDPAPEWNPSAHVLCARSIGGFSMLEEGGPGEQIFAADDRRECHDPRWLNQTQFVFGPGWNARRAPDGTVTTPTEGLTVVTMAGGKPVSKVQLADRGARPRPAGNALVAAQDGNRIFFVDSVGTISEFGEGFDAEPQPDGPGLAWRDTPAFEPDWWTGRSGPGVMHIRWKPGRVGDLSNGVQVAWTRRGGVLATVLTGVAAEGQPWWSGGTSIIHLAGPGFPPVPVRSGARDPAPHPIADLLAWTSDDGAVWIGTIRDGTASWSERVADRGSRPRWSHDGLRLCYLEPPLAGSQVPAIRVAVLAVR